MSKNGTFKEAYSFLFAIIIVLLTYKSPSIDLTWGLDSGYMWALNYLFIHDFSFLKNIIYPIGPYGFLKHPATLGNLPLVSIVITQVLKTILLFLSLSKKDDFNFYIKALLLLLASFFIDIDHIIVFLIIVIFLRFKLNLIAILSVALLAALGILIKSSIGIASLGIVVLYFLYEFFNTDKLKTAKISLIFILSFIVFGSLLLLDISSFFNFVLNTFKLANSYGEALALFPDNNWFYLSIFIASCFIAIFLTKNNWLIFLLVCFPLFTMWKHAMIREEFFHCKVLLKFIPFLFFILITESRKPIYAGLIGCIAFFSFYQNTKLFDNFQPISFYWNGLKEVNKSILNYSSYYDINKAQSVENLKSRIIPDSILSLIGNETVDVFPHDLSYLAANKLNYKFRPTLQSGAFSPWLEKMDTDGLLANYIIFHYSKDNTGNELANFDDRYLPNDGVSTFIKLGMNYTPILKTKEFILLKKKVDEFKSSTETMSYSNSNKFGFPVNLPLFDSNYVYHAKINLKENLLEKIKKIFYKSEPRFIEYTLTNQYSKRFRFIPNNEVLIHPFYTTLDTVSDFGIKYFTIIGDTTKSFNIEWKRTKKSKEFYGMNFSKEMIYKGSPYNDSSLKDSLQTIKSQGYGASFTLNFNEANFDVNTDKIQVEITGIVSSDLWNQSKVVMALERNGKVFYWTANELMSYPPKKHHFRMTRILDKSEFKDAKINAYLWNTGSFEMKSHDMKMDIHYID